MITWTEQSSAPPEQAWQLIAEPSRWHEWAPHIRGAWGLGSPEVEKGARGIVRLLGAIPVPARIVAKQPGHSWTWRVGPALLVHSVNKSDNGCAVTIDLLAPAPLERALAVTYGPIIATMLKRLARTAAKQ